MATGNELLTLPTQHFTGHSRVGVDEENLDLADCVRSFNRDAVFTNATRPSAAALPAGYRIWNSSDGAPNWADGAGNWRDAAGAIT